MFQQQQHMDHDMHHAAPAAGLGHHQQPSGANDLLEILRQQLSQQRKVVIPHNGSTNTEQGSLSSSVDQQIHQQSFLQSLLSRGGALSDGLIGASTSSSTSHKLSI